MVNRPLCVCPTDTWRSVPPEWLHSGSDSLPRTHKDSLLQLVHASGKVKHTLQHLGIMYFDLNILKIVSGRGVWGGRCHPNLLPYTLAVFFPPKRLTWSLRGQKRRC